MLYASLERERESGYATCWAHKYSSSVLNIGSFLKKNVRKKVSHEFLFPKA
jgi:hypothetical protein